MATVIDYGVCLDPAQGWIVSKRRYAMGVPVWNVVLAAEGILKVVIAPVQEVADVVAEVFRAIEDRGDKCNYSCPPLPGMSRVDGFEHDLDLDSLLIRQPYQAVPSMFV